VTAVRFEDSKPAAVTLPNATDWIGRAWSATFQENLKEAIRRAYYRKGFRM